MRAGLAIAVLGALVGATGIENRALGTTVVALRGRDYIIVAADSREVRISQDGTIRDSRDDACKIFEKDQVLYAQAGISGSSAGFNVGVLARSAMKAGRNLEQIRSEFESAALPSVEGELRRWRTQPRETPEGIPGIHYMFAHVSNGRPELVWGGIGGFRSIDRTIVGKVYERGAWPGARENVTRDWLTSCDRSSHRPRADRLSYRSRGRSRCEGDDTARIR